MKIKTTYCVILVLFGCGLAGMKIINSDGFQPNFTYTSHGDR